MNFCACPISLLGLTIKYVRLNLTSFVCEYLTIIGWGYTECYDLSKSKILREPSPFFYYSNIKFIFILKSVSGSSGRRTAIFHTRVWLQLRMSRIWFAAKHNLTVWRVTRTLFAGSHLQVKWWAFGQWVHRIITFSSSVDSDIFLTLSFFHFSSDRDSILPASWIRWTHHIGDN